MPRKPSSKPKMQRGRSKLRFVTTKAKGGTLKRIYNEQVGIKPLKRVPTAEERAKVISLAALGTPLKHIAIMIACKSPAWVLKHFRHELEIGEAQAVASIGSKLYTKAMEGDNACMFKFLQIRGGDQWKEKVTVENTGPGGGPQQHVHTFDVASLTTEQLKALEPLLAQAAIEGKS